MFFLFSFACAGHIKELYDAEKAAVMADPEQIVGDWAPELRLRISDGALSELATGVINAGLTEWDKELELKNPLGIKISVKPYGKLKKLGVKVGEGCASCVGLEGAIKGGAKWVAGPLSGELPFNAELGARMKFEVVRTGRTWTVSGKLLGVDKLKLSDGQISGLDMASPLKGWIDDALERADPIQLGEFGGEALPLRAMRLDGTAGMLEIQALSNVPGGAAVQAGGALSSDWELRMSQETALALMRRAAFEAGIQEHDIAIDPRSLRVQNDDFQLGLRVWRLSGAGWWREYSVFGHIGLQDDKLAFKSTKAEEGEKSKGAGIADPLALLFESVILDTVAKGINEALPAAEEARVGKLHVVARTEAVKGAAAALVVSGSLKAKRE